MTKSDNYFIKNNMVTIKITNTIPILPVTCGYLLDSSVVKINTI